MSRPLPVILNPVFVCLSASMHAYMRLYVLKKTNWENYKNTYCNVGEIR